jgi:hypothetical protein
LEETIVRKDEIQCWNVEMAKNKKSGTIKERFGKMNSDGIILIGLQQIKEIIITGWLVALFP